MNVFHWLARRTRRALTNPVRGIPKAPRPKLMVEELEGRAVPASTIVAAVGAGYGGGPEVTVLFNDHTQLRFDAFDPNFRGGVSAILAHVNGTPVPDVVVGAGRGGSPLVQVFDGEHLLAGRVVETAAFFALDSGLRDGVSLAAGHVDGSSHDDVIVTNGRGGPPEVAVFDGARLAQGRAVATASFSAFSPGFTGGVSLAVGYVNGTGHADVIVGAGPGGGPEVKVVDGQQLALGAAVATADFFAFPAGFSGGVVVASGHVNGTTHADVVVGTQPGGGPEIAVFDGASLARGQAVATAAFDAFDPSFRNGVTLAVGAVNGTGHADVIVGAGPGGAPEVKVFDGASLAKGLVVVTADYYAFNAAFRGGVQVCLTREPGVSTDVLMVVPGVGGGPECEFYVPALFYATGYVPTYACFVFDPGFSGGCDFGYEFCDYGENGATFIVFGGPADSLPDTVDGTVLPGSESESAGETPSSTGDTGGPSGGTPDSGGGAGSGEVNNPAGSDTSTDVTGEGDVLVGSDPDTTGETSGTDTTAGDVSGTDTTGDGSDGGDSGVSSDSGDPSGGGDSGGDFLRAARPLPAGMLPASGLMLAPGTFTLDTVHNQPAASPFAGAPDTSLNRASGILSLAGFERVTEAALSWWEAAGISPTHEQRLLDTHFVVGSLPSGDLGRTTGDTVTLSPTAAGYGWYASPSSTTLPSQTSPDMDLATVLAHEMGHELGSDHTQNPADVMFPVLTPGLRRTPTARDVVAYFSQESSLS